MCDVEEAQEQIDRDVTKKEVILLPSFFLLHNILYRIKR